jgi:hypothetical protein
MKRLILAASIAGFAALPSVAQEGQAATGTHCAAPTAPPAPVSLDMPPKPADPPCAGADGNVSRCSRKQVADFNAQVDAYNKALGPANEKLGEYVLALNGYQLAVTKYANCEINRVNGLVK